jgi:hypothetical protein
LTWRKNPRGLCPAEIIGKRQLGDKSHEDYAHAGTMFTRIVEIVGWVEGDSKYWLQPYVLLKPNILRDKRMLGFGRHELHNKMCGKAALNPTYWTLIFTPPSEL